jgi:hypothetical protein
MRICVAVLMLFLSRPGLVQAKEAMSWFKNINCTELNIIKYKSISEQTAVAEITVKDKAAIDDLMKRIEALPTSGEEMVKPGPHTPLTKLTFNCADQNNQVIEILNNKFKTPSSGFIAEKNSHEESLAEDIDALVQPGLNKKILKIKDQPMKFKDFILTYTGAEYIPAPKDGPTIGPRTKTFFSVRVPGLGNETILSISEGQLPPAPQSFLAAKKEYILLTYESSKKERLYPKYFEVTDHFSK